MTLPAPTHSPHESCKKAAKVIRKYTRVHVDDEKKHLLLHWHIRDHGLVVQGRDYLKLLIKGAYRLPAPSAKGKKGKEAVGSSGTSVRFLTCERAVYIQPSAESLTAVLSRRDGTHIDVHRGGDFAIELKVEQPYIGGADGGAAAMYQACVDDSGRDEGDDRASYHVDALTLRFDMPQLLDEIAMAVHSASGGADASGKDGGSGGAAAAAVAVMRPDSVRNLDTGEVFHLGEVDERVSHGIQPSSLRPISRVTVPPAHFTEVRPAEHAGLLSGVRSALANALGSDSLTRPVALEPCLLPLPPLHISGELLTGVSLKCTASPDLFVVGDGLAKGRAAAIEQVTWRRHRSTADVGIVLCTTRLALSSRTLGRSCSYTCSVEDAGCYLSATWQHGAVAVSGGFIQVHPNLRDAVHAATAAARASFSTSLREVSKRRRGDPAPHSKRYGSGGACGGASGASGASGGHAEKEGVLKLDGVARTVEISWRGGIGLRQHILKPLSKFTKAYAASSEADGCVLELVLSARRSCVLRCASKFERDLLMLTLVAFVREWPPSGCAPTPLLTNGIVLELAIAANEEDGRPTGGGGRVGSPVRADSSGQLIPTLRQGLTKPLRGAVSLQDEIVAAPSRALNADGLEYCWFRTTRTGGRSLIMHARGPSYAPCADDFGCHLTLACIPFSQPEDELLPHGGGVGGVGVSASRASRLATADDDDSLSDLSDDGSGSSHAGGGGSGSFNAPHTVRGSHAGESRHMHHSGNGGCGASRSTPPSEWLYGKPAHARLPQEVRLPEALEWKLHRLCAKGGGEFAVRILPAADAAADAAGLVDVSTEGGGGGGGGLTLALGKTSLHIKSGWGGPRRTQAEYAHGVGVSIEHWAKDVVCLHLPAAAGGPDAPGAPDDADDVHLIGRSPSSLARARATFQSGVGVGVGGETTDGVTIRLEVLSGREARDLLVLCLRYLVATAARSGRDR